MRRFQSILYVAHGTPDGGALEQALSEARHNKAALHAIAICPALPLDLAEYKTSYEASLLERVGVAIASAKTSLGIGPSEVPVTVELECGDVPAVSIVRRVLRDAHDLLIKQAEPTDRRTGFRSLDMQLLRTCPRPVWLWRPIARSRADVQVAVAVNPRSEVRLEWDLALQLLRLARSLADAHSGKLRIISCWEFGFEEDLRHSPWLKISEEAIQDAVTNAERHHRAAFEKLMRESGIDGAASVLLHRGRPDKVIPRLVDTLGIDLLIMGTVARTGIQGFIIGNTAENVLNGVSCSLLAAKPNGFVSPISAYE